MINNLDDIASINAMKIIIHTGVNEQTRDYAEMMVVVAHGLSSKKSEIEIRYHQLPDGDKGPQAYCNWLDEALQECDPALYPDPVIHVIADADSVLLQADWDVELNKIFLKDDRSCFGTSYEAIGGLPSGHGNLQTYKDRPTFTWIALSPFMSWADFDPSHRKDQPQSVANWTDSQIFGLPVGSLLFRDAAWSFPQFLYDRGCLSSARCMSHEKVNPRVVPKDIIGYSEEFHWKGEPFLAHQRGSGQRGFFVDPVSKKFYKAICEYLLHEKLSVERSV